MCNNCMEKEKDISLDEKSLGRKLMGMFYGYPDCCINWFIKRARTIDKVVKNSLSKEEIIKASELPNNQKDFKFGFIPCPDCAKITKPGEEGLLIKDRICPDLFPVIANKLYNEEFNNFIKSLI